MNLNAFTIVSNFRFEIGSALLGTQKVQSAVDELQRSIDNVNRTALSIGVSFLAGSSGIYSVIGALGVAIRASDKYRDSQASLANVFSATKENLQGPIETFNQQLQLSSQLISEMVSQANQFGLPADDLVTMTKLLSPLLISKGVAGDNLKGAIDISRNLLKSAPNLGIEPYEVQGQLMRALEGGASAGDTLFRRLTADTKAMSRFRGPGGTQKFNALDTVQKFELLSKAMSEFSSDVNVLNFRFRSLRGQMNIFKNLMSPGSVGSIFVPLGNVLHDSLVSALIPLNSFLQNEGRRLIVSLSEFVEDFVKDPRKLLTNLLTLSDTAKNLKTTGSTMGLFAVTAGVSEVTKHVFGTTVLGAFFAAIKPASRAIGSATGRLFKGATVSGIIRVLGSISTGLMFLGRASAAVFFPMTILLGVLQLITRASAIAKVRDLEAVPKLAEKFMNSMNKFKKVYDIVVGPFVWLFDSIAGAIANLFMITPLIDFFVGAVDRMADALIMIISVIRGVAAAMAEVYTSIVSGNIAGLNFEKLFDVAQREMIAEWDQLQGNKTAKDGVNVSNNVNVNNYVTMNNDFKETMQPDRIAFTIKEQLMKASVSRTQGRNGSVSVGILSVIGGE